MKQNNLVQKRRKERTAFITRCGCCDVHSTSKKSYVSLFSIEFYFSFIQCNVNACNAAFKSEHLKNDFRVINSTWQEKIVFQQ